MTTTLIILLTGAFLNLSGCARYGVGTLRGKVRPNPVTWLLWAVAPLVAFFAELGRNVGISALTTLSVALGPLFVVSCALLRPGGVRHKLTVAEILCGTSSVAALIAWYVTSDPDAAIALSIVADFLAALPTLVKSHRNPESEDPSTYLATAACAVLTLGALSRWTFSASAFQVYLLTASCLILYPQLRARRAARHQRWRNLRTQMHDPALHPRPRRLGVGFALGTAVLAPLAAGVIWSLHLPASGAAGAAPRTQPAVIEQPPPSAENAPAELPRPRAGGSTPPVVGATTAIGGQDAAGSALAPLPRATPRVVPASTSRPPAPQPTRTPSPSPMPTPTRTSPPPSPTPTPSASSATPAPSPTHS